MHRQRFSARGNRMLSFLELGKMDFRLKVAADFRVPEMFPRHQHIPRGSTNRSA